MRFNSKIILLVWLSVIDSLLMDIHVLEFSQHGTQNYDFRNKQERNFKKDFRCEYLKFLDMIFT